MLIFPAVDSTGQTQLTLLLAAQFQPLASFSRQVTGKVSFWVFLIEIKCRSEHLPWMYCTYEVQIPKHSLK